MPPGVRVPSSSRTQPTSHAPAATLIARTLTPAYPPSGDETRGRSGTAHAHLGNPPTARRKTSRRRRRRTVRQHPPQAQQQPGRPCICRLTCREMASRIRSGGSRPARLPGISLGRVRRRPPPGESLAATSDCAVTRPRHAPANMIHRPARGRASRDESDMEPQSDDQQQAATAGQDAGMRDRAPATAQQGQYAGTAGWSYRRRGRVGPGCRPRPAPPDHRAAEEGVNRRVAATDT